MKLPKQIYVTIENDPNDRNGHWLNAAKTTDGIEHGSTVGIYALVEVKKVEVTRKLK